MNCSNRFGVVVISFLLSTFSYLLRKVKRQKTMPEIVEDKNYNISTKSIIAYSTIEKKTRFKRNESFPN